MRRADETDYVFSADPDECRRARRIEASDILRQTMCDVGAVRSVVAAHLGVSEAHLRKCEDASESAQIQFADVLGLPPLVQLAILRWWAESLGHDVVELPEEVDFASDLQAAARAARDSGQAVSAMVEAASDGVIDRAEGARIEREADRAVATLLYVRERGRRARREGVIGLRRARERKPSAAPRSEGVA